MKNIQFTPKLVHACTFILICITYILFLTSCRDEENTDLNQLYTETMCGELFGKVLHDPKIIYKLDSYLHFTTNMGLSSQLYLDDFNFCIRQHWLKNPGVFQRSSCETLAAESLGGLFFRTEGKVIDTPRIFKTCYFPNDELLAAINEIESEYRNVVNESNCNGQKSLILEFLQPQKTKNSFYQLVKINLNNSPTSIVYLALYFRVNDLKLIFYEINPENLHFK